VPSFAIDDQTAIKVTDGTIEVISEGQWKRFNHLHEQKIKADNL
jgi:dipeptidase E